MPAKIKKAELQQLNFFLKAGMEQQYWVYKALLLQQHGSNLRTHDINLEGWIVETQWK